ncbi:MAG: FHA domain-containing protein [Chloroflexi bacterium]|nr:FHA domain-containing protein [Chloroflexota bacterium]
MPWFLIDSTGYRYPIGATGLSLGRAADNDVVLPDDEASRHHATIQIKDDQAWLFDRDSSNGTYLNDTRLSQPRQLASGDRLRIGRAAMRVDYVSSPPLVPADTAPQAASSPPASPWPAVIAGALVGVAGLLLVYLAFVRPIMQRSVATAPTTVADHYALYNRALASIVFVLTPIDGTESAAAGTGVVVADTGRILTAYSVVLDPNTQQPYNHKSQVIIGLNQSGVYDGQALRDWYLARVVRADPQRDLAVLQIFAMQDDSPLPNSFRLTAIERSPTPSTREQSPLAVISFMAAGIGQQNIGRALTIGTGSVLGYLPDATLNNPRGWMQSDIQLTLANLGGLALDEQGQLVGMYTGAKSGPGALLRPIELANPLLVGVR